MKLTHIHTAVIILVVGAVAGVLASIDFLKMTKPDIIYPAETLTKTAKLSDFNENLLGTNGDADIYFFDGASEGATVLLLGGTHPNEPAGFMTALLLVENIHVDAGRVIVIPQACTSGFSCTDPMEGYPEFFHLQTRSGLRQFRFGSRVSNPLDQWPDPLVYSHIPSGQKLSGFETRNLNRSYPGIKDGTFTERVAYAIVELIKEENVTVAFDLHEAAPEIPIIDAIVYHEKSEDIAMMAIMNLQFQDLSYAPEASPKNFHGLSHREWGDNTDVLPFLMETCNPIQGRLRGKTNEELILSGHSHQYLLAKQTGKLRIEYEDEGESIYRRVGRHLSGFLELLNSYNGYYPDKPIIISNIPAYHDLMENGLENYLN